MSDTWQGEGWWIASDGKWYPPESHPDAVDAVPPVPVGSAPKASAPEASVTADPGAPAEAPPTPAAPTSRWLGRSPQPPAPAPAPVAAGNGSDKPPVPPTSSRWSKPRAAASPVTATPPAAVTPVVYPLLDGPVQRRPPPRPVAIWVFISIGAVVLTVVIALLVGFGGGDSLLVTERGTITVVFPAHGRPTFSGTVNGSALTGRVTASTTSPAPSVQGQVAPSTDSLVYKGRYGGNAYVLHLSLTTPAPNVDDEGDWEVTGTDGSSRVTGEATYNLASEGDQIPFSGAIGSKPFNGTAVIQRSGGSMEITVTYINLP